MTLRWPGLVLLSPLVVLLAHSPARADCDSGAGYHASLDSTTPTSVDIDLIDTARTCPDPSGMLRQDETTGAVVRLADTCSSPNIYVDECVPAGTYRYGYATPFDCSESACSGVGLFDEITVTASPTGCTRSTGDPGPTAVTTMPPWGVGGPDSGLAQYKDCPHGCACGSVGGGRTRVVSVDIVIGACALAWMVVRRYRRHKSA
jgi:hypothetical protein